MAKDLYRFKMALCFISVSRTVSGHFNRPVKRDLMLLMSKFNWDTVDFILESDTERLRLDLVSLAEDVDDLHRKCVQ